MGSLLPRPGQKFRIMRGAEHNDAYCYRTGDATLVVTVQYCHSAGITRPPESLYDCHGFTLRALLDVLDEDIYTPADI